MKNALSLVLIVALFETGLCCQDRLGFAAPQSQQPAPSPTTLVLPKGIGLCLFPDGLVSTRTAKIGQRMSFRAGRDIQVDDVTLIPEGTKVLGVISEVLRPKIGKKDGRLSFVFEPVPLVSGDVVPIQSAIVAEPPTPRQQKRSPTQDMAKVGEALKEAWDDPYSIFWPLALPFAVLIPLEKGEEQVLPTWNCVPQQTAQDVVITKRKVVSLQVANGATTQAPVAPQTTSPVVLSPGSQWQTLAQWHGIQARTIAFTRDAVWVAGCDAGGCGVTRIEASSDKIVATIRTPQAPYGVAASEDGVWTSIPQENSIIRIDPATNQIVARVPTGKTPTDVAAGEGAIWVANARDKSVSRIDPRQNAVTATVRVGGFPGSIAIGEGGVWVANGEGCWGCSFGTISRIDPATNSVVKTIKTWKYGTEVSPSELRVQDGIVWAIAGEHILRIDPQTNKIVKWIRIPSKKLFSMPEGFGPIKLNGLAIIQGMLWVANTSEASLWKIDLHTDKVSDEPVAVGFPVKILGQSEEKDGAVWLSNVHEGSVLKVKP